MINTDGLTVLGAGSEWFWSMLQFVIVAITLVGIYVQLRHGRAANAFAQANALGEEWRGERNVRRFLAMAIAIRDDGLDADLSALYVPIATFWENAGALVRAGHIETAVVRDVLGGACRSSWSILEPQVRRVQAAEGSDVWEHFEWLAGEIARIDRAHGQPDDVYARVRAIEIMVAGIPGLRAGLADFEAMRAVNVIPSASPLPAAADTRTDEAAEPR